MNGKRADKEAPSNRSTTTVTRLGLCTTADRVVLGLCFGGLLFSFLAGCGGHKGEAEVVSCRGWGLTLSQLEQEYNRVSGPDAFAAATRSERETFARTLADKELLLRLAKNASPKLTGRQARIYRISYEKELLKGYLKWRRDLFRFSAEEERRLLPLLGREARVRVAALPSRDLKEQVLAEQKAGETFEQIAGKHAAPDRSGSPGGGALSAAPGRWREMTIKVDDPTPSPILINQALLADLPEGGMSPPFDAPMGTLFLQVMKITPNPAAADTAYQAKARRILTAIGYMRYYPQWNDSLKQAAGLSFMDQGIPVIQTRFAAYWDSINQMTGTSTAVDFQGLRGPVWRFTPEEQALPVCNLWGKILTVGDYVRSLDDIDLDFWPTVGPLGKITQQVQGRIYRLLLQQDAEKKGLSKLPWLAQEMRVREEKGLLDQFHDAAGANLPALTEEKLKRIYADLPTKYRMPETISLSILSYPKAKAARAKQTLARLRAGGPLSWLDLAPAEHKADTTVIYVADSGSMNVEKPPKDATWIPLMEAAKKMTAGQVSEVIATGDRVSIMRVSEHNASAIVPYEKAAFLLRQNFMQARQDSVVEVALTAERTKAGVKVYTERLGEATKAKAQDKPQG